MPDLFAKIIYWRQDRWWTTRFIKNCFSEHTETPEYLRNASPLFLSPVWAVGPHQPAPCWSRRSPPDRNETDHRQTGTNRRPGAMGRCGRASEAGTGGKGETAYRRLTVARERRTAAGRRPCGPQACRYPLRWARPDPQDLRREIMSGWIGENRAEGIPHLWSPL